MRVSDFPTGLSSGSWETLTPDWETPVGVESALTEPSRPVLSGTLRALLMPMLFTCSLKSVKEKQRKEMLNKRIQYLLEKIQQKFRFILISSSTRSLTYCGPWEFRNSYPRLLIQGGHKPRVPSQKNLLRGRSENWDPPENLWLKGHRRRKLRLFPLCLPNVEASVLYLEERDRLQIRKCWVSRFIGQVSLLESNSPHIR